MDGVLPGGEGSVVIVVALFQLGSKGGEPGAIFEFGRGFYGNTYISVLSTLTLTPTAHCMIVAFSSYQPTSTRFEW